MTIRNGHEAPGFRADHRHPFCAAAGHHLEGAPATEQRHKSHNDNSRQSSFSPVPRSLNIFFFHRSGILPYNDFKLFEHFKRLEPEYDFLPLPFGPTSSASPSPPATALIKARQKVRPIAGIHAMCGGSFPFCKMVYAAKSSAK